MSTKMLFQVTGNGSPIVLVPGGLTGWLDWKLHAEYLEATRKVVRVQLLNVQHGFENHLLPPDYSVKTESEALAATLDALGLYTPIDLVAWSFGALVTLDYALDNAERVRSLILIEPPAYWVLRASGKMDAEAERAIIFNWTMYDDISEDQLEQFLWAVGLCPIGKPARKLPQWTLLNRYRQSLRNTYILSKHSDDLKRLRSFHRPVLLVKGIGSLRVLHKIIDALAAQLPKVQLIEMPHGHAPHIISKDFFLEQIKDFHESLRD